MASTMTLYRACVHIRPFGGDSDAHIYADSWAFEMLPGSESGSMRAFDPGYRCFSTALWEQVPVKVEIPDGAKLERHPNTYWLLKWNSPTGERYANALDVAKMAESRRDGFSFVAEQKTAEGSPRLAQVAA
jgi:hypothetical protein